MRPRADQAALAVGALAAATIVTLGASPVSTPAAAATGSDYAGQALNVLPPGQAGGTRLTRNSQDQVRLYDGLTPRRGSVRAGDLRRHFKSARFGLSGRRRGPVERPGRRGLRIVRDRWGVPHVYAARRSGVMFGAGWIAAEDRGTLMEVLRGPAYIATVDAPGLDPVELATGFRRFDPSRATTRRLSRQVSLLRRQGRRGRRVVADLNSYVAGINAYNRDAARPVKRWTPNDVIAVGSLVGAIFGKGGGDETRRSQLLSALSQRLGPLVGQQVWEDLRELQDPETPVTVARPIFPYAGPVPQHPGNVVVDHGSFVAQASSTSGGPVAGGAAAPSPAGAEAVAPERRSSNALLVSARRSVNGHPLFVAGPQVGYFYPELLMEQDLHGGGIDVRGVAVAGIPYVLIGRGQDFAWSATSAGSDIVDQFIEELCGNDTTYRYRGKCVPMTTFNAGVLGAGGGQPARSVVFRETVHGPVIGYATVGGRRVAISVKRSTRRREALSALAFAELNANRVRSARGFTRVMSRVDFTFNWFYADHRDIAVFTSGRQPVRSQGVDPGLPTIGTGAYEWLGFLPRGRHPRTINPSGGLILNWNNKPARGFGASDSNWSYGSIHRNQLLEDAVQRRRRHSLVTLVGAMNRAATQDLRAARVLPSIADVLRTGPPPTSRARRMLELLEGWRRRGASRIDRDLDGRIDDPGAAIMDAAWARIADAAMEPVLGPQLSRLATAHPRDDPANSAGSSYGGGWYGYLDKDLRTLLGRPVAGPFRTRFCGRGVLAACRADLWAALDRAGAELQAAQGPDPANWRSDARGERIKFEPGILPRTMRWTNRPTFQQVMFFNGHR